ncbi:hypothetical protein WCE34_14195 [Luteimonas sp. MJ204]|uniref:hypothetical protein n=1 Tax=Luteimonas sp. MJ145 TaxID=3129234 RepID=UPI0031BABD1E
MKVGNIGQQELDLLECLIRIDAHQSLDHRADDMLMRLIEAGLVDSSSGSLRLTLSGIERCQSLQHRIAGDKDAAKVLADRGISIALDK